MDRRARQRFDLSAPVTYMWVNSHARPHSSAGVTRDVSERGVFVLGDSLPPVGATVQIEVSFSFRDDSQITMKAQGTVLRVLAAEGKMQSGFAAMTKEPVLSPAGRIPEGI